MPELPDAVPLAILLAILALAGFIRGLTGFGGALVAIPVASAVLGPRAAIAILALTDLPATLPLLPPAFRRCDWSTVLPAALAAIVSVPIGTFILASTDPVSLRWGLSVTVLAMLALLMSGWRYRGAPRAPVSAAVGAIAGIFSGAAGIPGPPIVTYWMSGPAEKAVLRANLISFFAFTTIGSLTAYALAGLFTPSVMVSALAALPVYGLAAWLGARAHRTTPEARFRTVAFALIALSAIIGLPALDPVLRGT